MSGIGSITSKSVGVVGTINGDPADIRVAPDGGGRLASGMGVPPIVNQLGVLGGLFAAPLPQPKVEPTSVDRLTAKLASNEPVDFAQLMLMFEEEQQKVDKEQQKSKVVELESNKNAIKNTVNRDLKKLDEAVEKLEKQKKWGIFGKIFKAIAIALSVVAAVATGGILAPAIAIVAAAVTILEETGAMKKMFDAMGLSENAQKWIMVGISAALLVAGLGAAGMALKAASAAQAAAGAGAAVVVSVVMRQISAAAQVVGGVVKVGEGATQVGSAVNQYQIAKIEDDRKEIEAVNLQLKKQQDDLAQALQALIQKMEESVNAVVQIVSGQAQSIEQNMRALKT